jgi:hypothetical protein
MYAPLRWAIRDIRNCFVLNGAARQQYLLDPQRHFTRKRHLTFERTAALVFSL